MGFHIAVGPCLLCKRPFGYNPAKVPSHPARGGFPSADPTDPKAPICQECIKVVNTERARAGQPQWPVPDDAYKPAEGIPG